MRNVCARRKAMGFNGLHKKFCDFQFNARNLLPRVIRGNCSDEEAVKMKQNDTDRTKEEAGKSKIKEDIE